MGCTNISKWGLALLTGLFLTTPSVQASTIFEDEQEIQNFLKGCVAACAENPKDFDICKSQCQCTIDNASDFLTRDELLQLGWDSIPEEVKKKGYNLANFCKKAP